MITAISTQQHGRDDRRNRTPMYIILDVCVRVVYLPIIATAVSVCMFLYSLDILLSPNLVTSYYMFVSSL